MKSKITLTSPLLIILFFLNSASASVWFEPYAGYEIGDQEIGTTSYDSSGLNLGFRLGAKMTSLFFGLDYTLGDLTVDKTNNDEDLKTKDLGVFVGNDFGTLRLWFTYWLDSEGDSDSSDCEGSGGYKFGLGFKAFSSASLNVEKTLRSWDECGGNKQNPEIEIDSILFSLSLPFSL